MQFSNNSLLLYDKNTGIIILNFYKDFSVKNKVCTLELKIDILTKKVYYVLYQKGHGKSLVLNQDKDMKKFFRCLYPLTYLDLEMIDVS